MDRREVLRWLSRGSVGAWLATSLPHSAGATPAHPLQTGAASGDEGPAGDSEDAAGPLSYVDPKVQRYRCGLELTMGQGVCRGVIATFPYPRAWPEQEVRLLNKQIDPLFARWQDRELDGLVRQFVTRVGFVPAGTQASALLTFELTRYRILGPDDPASLRKPERPGRELRQFLGSSPYIDPGSARIRAAVREIEAIPAGTAWTRVEQIYDWVREKISYVEGDIKSADDALRDGTGDCEELTSVFVAICRAMRIPARMVHVLMHCYPEFYLEDAQGEGHWFPCQAAGTRQFGTMEEYRPILQKGDRFKTPERPLRRYVAEFFQAAAVRGADPRPRFVQELLD